jgi:PKHD-type hydroxylase
MFTSYNFDKRENEPLQHYSFESGFTRDELNTIDQGIKSIQLNKATTLGEQSDSIRISRVRWLPQDETWSWMYSRLENMIQEANDALWQFELISMPEMIQFTEYHADEKGHYNWHQDLGPGIASGRKVSVTVQLSAPEDYEGGELQLTHGGPHELAYTAPKTEGSVTIFPSYMLHRVTPVTKGIRKSFVLWVGGMPFK